MLVLVKCDPHRLHKARMRLIDLRLAWLVALRHCSRDTLLIQHCLVGSSIAAGNDSANHSCLQQHSTLGDMHPHTAGAAGIMQCCE